MQLRLFLLLFGSLFISGKLCAQDNVWKKEVRRLIDTRDSTDKNGHIVATKPTGDTAFARALTDAVVSSKIIAYGAYDYPFAKTISKEGLRLVAEYSPKGTYRIIEEWSFDPIKRTTKIQILGIEPLKEIYDNDGVYRGHQAVFTVKWTDIKGLLEQYNNGHPLHHFEEYVWADYFKYQNLLPDTLSDATEDAASLQKGWTKKALRTVAFADTIDLDYKHLQQHHDESPLTGELYTALMDKTLTGYSDTGKRFNNVLSYYDIGLATVPDTMQVTDPVTQEIKIVITQYDLNSNWFNQYTVLEEWAFDPQAGKTNIRICGLEPRIDLSDSKYTLFNNLCWFRYEDITGILDHWYQHHPLNNLSTAIWQSYFEPAAKR